MKPPASSLLAGGALLAAGAAAVLAGDRLTARGIVAWQDRAGLERIAGEIAAETTGRPEDDAPRRRSQCVVYVYGEPGLFFHLAAESARTGAPLVPAPVGDLAFAESGSNDPSATTFLAVGGPHAEPSASFAERWRRYKDRFALVGRYPYRPSDLVLLNHDPPVVAAAPDHPEIRLFRIR